MKRWYLNGKWIEGKSDLSSKMEISLSEGQWLECRCVNSRGSSTLLVRTSEPSAGSGADSADFEVDFEDGSSPSPVDEEVNLDLKITVEEDKILVDWAMDSSRDFMNLNYFLLDGRVFATKNSIFPQTPPPKKILVFDPKYRWSKFFQWNLLILVFVPRRSENTLVRSDLEKL